MRNTAMTRSPYDVSDEMHEACARQCFNDTWALLDKPDRSDDDNDLMLHTAHCSMYHWLKVGQPKHFARGNWLLSRVHAVLGHGDRAISFARRCAELCSTHALSPFDRAYAHEALARGFAVSHDAAQSQHHVDAARSLSPSIDNEQERQWLLDDLDTIGVA
jgi:hypothetical protein